MHEAHADSLEAPVLEDVPNIRGQRTVSQLEAKAPAAPSGRRHHPEPPAQRAEGAGLPLAVGRPRGNKAQAQARSATRRATAALSKGSLQCDL